MNPIVKVLILWAVFFSPLTSKAVTPSLEECLSAVQDPLDTDYSILRETQHPLDASFQAQQVTPRLLPNTVRTQGLVSSSSLEEIPAIHRVMNARAKQKGEAVLGRHLTQQEAQALVSVSQVKQFLSNKLLYLEESLQTQILKKANFSPEEIDQILFEEANNFLPDLTALTRISTQSILEGRALPGASPWFEYDLSPNPGYESFLRTSLGRIVSYDGPGKITVELFAEFAEASHNKIQQIQIEIETIDLIIPKDWRLQKISIYFHNSQSHSNGVDRVSNNLPLSIREITQKTGDGHLILDGSKDNSKDFPFKEMLNDPLHDVEIIMTSKMGEMIIAPSTFDINIIYTALRSNREVLKESELNLPEPTALPPPPLGYGPKHTKGWGEIQEQIAFAQAVRGLEVPPHPLKTHIEYFVHKTPIHIEHIEKGILEREDLSQEQVQTALELLEDLKQEADRAIQQKQVSYVWWVNFNVLLTQVADGKATAESSTLNSFKNNLKKINTEFITYMGPIGLFPFRMILPAVGGKLGIMTLNRAFLHHVWPFGLVTKPTEGDFPPELEAPSYFAMHDITHASLIHKSLEIDMIKDDIRAIMDSLSGEERTHLEETVFDKIQ